MVIVIIFNVAILGYSLSRGIPFVLSKQSLCYLFFMVCAVLGSIYTFRAYRQNKKNFLLGAALLFFIASIPSAVYILAGNRPTDPFLLTKFCLPSLVINLITYYLAVKNIDITKQKTILSEGKKVVQHNKKKQMPRH